MMKKIEFNRIAGRINRGTPDMPEWKNIVEKSVIRCAEEYLEVNLAIARQESCDGDITVEDIPDPVIEPSQLDQIEAQVTYTALMTDTLLDYEEE